MKTKIFIVNICIALMLIAVSCVEDEMYKGPATIGEIKYSPQEISPDDEVTVVATISDLQGVVAAKIEYTVNGGAKKEVGMSKENGDIYIGVIPKQTDESVVVFTVVVENKAGLTSISKEQTYTVGVIPVAYGNLVLNELNGNDKFIEVFNRGDIAIPLAGVYVEKDGKIVWTGSEEQSLPAGGYLLLYSEDVKGEMTDHPEDQFFGSGLSPKKAVRVQLFSPSGTSIDDFNLVGYEKPAPASYSRWENGTGKWMYADATPGKPNVEGAEEVIGLE